MDSEDDVRKGETEREIHAGQEICHWERSHRPAVNNTEYNVTEGA